VERGAAPNTLTSYRRDLDRYRDFLAERGVTQAGAVAEADVSDFLASLREGTPRRQPLAASSAARTLVAVRGFHRFLALEGEVGSDPAGAVTPPRPPRRLPKAIPVEDVERLLEAASLGDTAMSLRDRALFEVLYGVGARISEAVGLDVDDLDITDPGQGRARRSRHTLCGAVPRSPPAARALPRCSSTSEGRGSRARAPGGRSGRPPDGPD